MSWQKAREALLKKVVPLMKVNHRGKGQEWVEMLGQSNDGMRLAACIYIDVRYGAVKPELFADILNHLDPSKDGSRRSACWAFHDALMNHPENLLLDNKSHFACKSDFKTDGGGAEPYARILDIRDFIGRVLSTAENPLSALSRDDRARVRRMYFEREDEPWDDLDGIWTGRMGRVFVTSWRHLIGLLANSQGSTDPGGVVNDAMGLGLPVTTEFVAVKYPGSLDAKFHQPTALDADWANLNWYVSRRKVDGWGLTFCCSGSWPAAPERVHRGFENISGGFSGKYIGTPQKSLVENRAGLLDEAFTRM